MDHPEYAEEYGLTEEDFDVDVFYQLIFTTICNLYKGGLKVIRPFNIDSYLSNYEQQYKVFRLDEGTDYCTQALSMAEEENFPYYCNCIKKFSLLRYLEREGFDVRKIYNYDAPESEQEKEQKKLDEMSLEDIVDGLEMHLIVNSRLRYCGENQSQSMMMGDGIESLITSLEESPEYGMPLQSPMLTTACRGMRLKKLYIRSGGTASGKSRTALADFCNISIPWYYDTEKEKWTFTGRAEPALFISTELELDELQTIALAYVSGVQEERILNGKYEQGERDRVIQAAQYIESSAFYIEFLPNFTIADIENLIKKHKRTNGVSYVCFDYLHMSAKLIGELSLEMHGMKQTREDQLLFLFVDKLKNLCNTLDIFMLTMTQLNGTFKDSPIKDETMLRGAKSIADRIDLGEISMPPTSADLKSVDNIIARMINRPIPNLVRHIYKLRRGKLTKIRIWQYADLGTCRTEDLFVTNNDNELLNIKIEEVELLEEKMEQAIEETSVATSEIVNDPDEHAAPVLNVSFAW